MEIDASDALRMAADFDRVGSRLPAEARAKVAHYGARLHSAVVSRAPGTSYPGTIRAEPVNRGPFVGIAVTTDREDGWRREMGYHGTDRTGRKIEDNSGQAHFAPGFDEVAGDFEAAMARLALQD